MNSSIKSCFALTVGQDQYGTFLGSDEQIGYDWTLCHVDTVARKIVYGDSLGWPLLIGLLERV